MIHFDHSGQGTGKPAGISVGSDAFSFCCSTFNPLHRTWTHKYRQSYTRKHSINTSTPLQNQSVIEINTLTLVKALLAVEEWGVRDFGGQTATRLECWATAASSGLYEDGRWRLSSKTALLAWQCSLTALSALHYPAPVFLFKEVYAAVFYP